jgi:uncharacterized protein YjbI with pentapeptide repeats
MRVVKPQPTLANFSRTQWGSQAQMCIAIGVGFRLSDSRVLTHEASVWEALRVTPTVAPMSEMGMPKQFAEWLLAGHTQCMFSDAEPGLVRDWTAQVCLAKSEKKISAQSKVSQGAHGNTLGSLNVDHTESIQGANGANPAGHPDASAPLQVMTWRGPKSAALAGLTPIDARWPERRQWMPPFASTLEGMAEDGSHMGWPKDTDKRYFQQAAPDQWSADSAWTQGANYELRGFGTAACGFKGSLPKLSPNVVMVRGDTTESVVLMQQTVWFLPDHDLGVMWWSGSVNLSHPLDDSLSMMVVALREVGAHVKKEDMLDYAIKRTNVKVPDLSAQSDLPLLPALANGWAWEQILNADQHPRDRRVHLSYGQLREQITEEEERMAQAHAQMHQLSHAPSAPALKEPALRNAEHDPNAWQTQLAKTSNQQLSDETFTGQNFKGHDWTGWSLTNVRFESCVMDGGCWTDCVFENVEFIDSSLDKTQWRNLAWSQGGMERCQAHNAKWQNSSFTHVRWVQCALSENEVCGGQWRHVVMDEVECLSASWCQVMTENLVVMKSNLRSLSVRECKLDKLSILETDASWSQWVQSLFTHAAFVEGTDLSGSLWQDCDGTSSCWIGLLAQGARIEHCSFTNLNAQGAHLGRTSWLFCKLNDAQLLNADLRDASFESTSLRGALLSGALLQNSRITHSNLIQINTANAVQTAPGHWRNNMVGGAVMHPNRHE